MIKTVFITFTALLITLYSPAQSRVFKQVAEEISSDMDAITQDGSVVGYVVLTKLEKLNEDSFHYKLSLMDENLNDIGLIDIRDINMSLMGVAFDQDVLCLSYYKSDVNGTTFKNKREYNNAKDGSRNAIMNQFVSLDGKILHTHTFSINVDVTFDNLGRGKGIATAGLKNNGQIRNIPGKGFCFLYGDKDKSELINYNTQGEVVWKKSVDRYDYYSVIPTNDVLYVLGKNKKYPYAGYELGRFAVADGVKAQNYVLQDADGNPLRVLSFEMNPVTGKPFIAGSIIKKGFISGYETGRGYRKGMFAGTFSLTLSGLKKTDIKENFTHWTDGELKPYFSTRGFRKDTKSYIAMRGASQDSTGNVIFAGTTLRQKTRIGAIVGAVITAPLLIGPVLFLGGGIHKYRMQDAVILKQSSKGGLSEVQTLAKTNSGFMYQREPLWIYNVSDSYTSLYDPATKSDVIIYRDATGYKIYSISQNKISRTIPANSSNSSLQIFGAKEGHILVVENNRKEKYTKLSIEAI